MMKNNYNRWLTSVAFALAIALVSPLTLSSCGNDDDNDTPNEQKDDTPSSGEEAVKGVAHNEAEQVPEGTDTEERSAFIRDSIKTALLMNALCEVDAPETGEVTYTPRLGAVVNASTPTIYYSTAQSEEHAKSTYQSIVSVLREDGNGANELPNEITQGDITLTYTKGNADGELGRIIVDCPRLRNTLSAIVFLSEGAWPMNDVATPCNYLSIWQEVSTGRYYICVREAKGQTGVLMTFDGGWGEDPFNDTYWQKPFTTWTNCALQEHFGALQQGMVYNSTRFTNALKKLEDAAGRKNKTWDLLDDMFRLNRTIDFDCDYTWSKGRWWFKLNYYITVRYVRICKDYCLYLSMYCEHTKYPNKATPSYYKLFTQRDANDFKDTNKWRAIYR